MKRINDEALLERIGFNPHKGQKPIIEAIKDPTKRDFVLVCGRRFGKTFVAAYAAFRELLKPNRNIWIVAPTSDLTQKTFSYVLRFLSKIYEPGDFSIKNKPYTKLRMANGTWLECKTADNPVSLIGEELDLLIIDEAARIAPMVYERELAATTMSRKGRTIFISSPKGKNWFYNKYKSTEKNENGFVWNAPSSDNPKNSPEELERIKNTLPEAIWKQEYLAQFVDSGAEVFRNYRSCVRECLAKPKPDKKYYIGADLAKYKDFNVYVVLDRQTREVVYIDRTQGVNWVLQKRRLIELARQYNNARIIIDATGLGSPIVDDLKYAGLLVDPFVFTNTKKKQLIEKLIVFTEQEAVFIPPFKPLLEELSYFQKTISNSGNEIYAAPTGEFHDDCVIALALAVWLLPSVKMKKQKTNTEEELFNREKRMIKRKFQYS